MATKDFRANQIETSKIIGTGSIAGTTVGIAIYSGSIASNREGGTSDSAMFNDVGSDVFLFVSGTISNSDFNRTDATLFGGDVVISGTLYAERQVIEVDSVADGDFYVTGNMYVEPDANSDSSVVFSQADGTRVLKVNTSSPNVDIDGNLIVTGNIHMQSDNLDGINIDAENNFQIGAQGNIILTIDSDNDDSAGTRFFGVRDGGGAYGLAIYDRGDIIFNNSSLSTQDFQVRADSDNSAIYVDASEDAVAIGRTLNTDFGSESGVGTDVKILLSGTVGSKDGADRGVVLTPGDLVVSGTLYPGGNSDQFISSDGTEIIIDGNDHVDIRIDESFGVYTGAGGTTKPILGVYHDDVTEGRGTVINTNSLSYLDFRVESDSKLGSILVDGGTEQVAILVNSKDASTAYGGDAIPTEIDLFVSGAIGGKGTEGVAVFGGDVVISGSLHGGSPLQIGEYQSDLGSDVALFVSGTSGEGGGKGSTNGTTVIGTDLIVSGTYRGGYDALAGFETFQAVSEQYLLLSDENDFGLDQLTALDTNFFVSGSIGSKNSDTVKGTAVFGGDLHVSGAITAGGFPSYHYHSFYHSLTTGLGFVQFGPFESSAPATSLREITKGAWWVAPHDGTLNKIVITCTNVLFPGSGNETLTVSLYTNENSEAGNAVPIGHATGSIDQTVTFNDDGVTNTHYFGNVDFTNTTLARTGSNSFSTGDALSIGLQTSSNLNQVSITAVFELDTST